MSALCALIIVMTSGCNTIDDERIPNLSVNINLTPASSWQTYGVPGYGDFRYFIRDIREPSNFPWLATTTTGYGGVLLISGTDPFTNEVGVPLAYDMSCPVEKLPDVRVRITHIEDEVLPMAQCPVCKSFYGVIEGGGVARGGVARDKHYGLRMYQCVEGPNNMGGYLITNRR